MKRWIVISLLLLLAAGLSGETIEKTFTFHHYELDKKDEFQILRMLGTNPMGKTGDPLLPHFSAVILLPPGEVVQSVQVITRNEMHLHISSRIVPKQSVRKLSDTTPIPFKLNKGTYGEDAFYPKSQLASVNTAFMNGYSIGMVLFTPVQYNPVSGEIIIYKEITLQIETAIDDKALDALKFSRNSSSIHKRLVKLCHDSNALQHYFAADMGGQQDILVVVPEHFKDNFDVYKNFYLRKGLKTLVLTTETIQSSYPGQDLQEMIRNAIIDIYQNQGIQHVVLAGDVEHIPYRGFYCEVQSGDDLYQSVNIPSDLYYSALDGTWDDDGDSFWGEIGEDDLLPEVSVGRIPFSTQEDLDAQFHKIFTYQSDPVMGEFRRPLLAGEKFWDNPLSWGADYLDLLIGTHDDNGYTTQGIPEDFDYVTLTDRDDGRWSSQDLLDKIYNGAPFIHHSGHSNSNYNLRMTTSQITEDTFSTINGIDHNYSIIISHGCNSGAFDNADCIGETMVNIQNFAVAYVGNSRYGWDNEGQTEGPSTHLHRELVDAFYGHEIETLGQAHLQSKIDTAPWVNQPDEWEEGAQRWCIYTCNVLGDPVLSAWIDEPVTPTISYQFLPSNNEAHLSVRVMLDGASVEGLRCALVSSDSLFGVVVVDGNGLGQIPFDSSQVASKLELVVSGRNCLTTSFLVDEFSPVEIPEEGILVFRNYPNPFNEHTTLSYSLAEDGDVKLNIYNIKGQLVKTLVHENQKADYYSELWDGTDASGQKVGSGLYLYHVQSGKQHKVFKMTLLR